MLSDFEDVRLNAAHVGAFEIDAAPILDEAVAFHLHVPGGITADGLDPIGQTFKDVRVLVGTVRTAAEAELLAILEHIEFTVDRFDAVPSFKGMIVGRGGFIDEGTACYIQFFNAEQFHVDVRGFPEFVFQIGRCEKARVIEDGNGLVLKDPIFLDIDQVVLEAGILGSDPTSPDRQELSLEG